MIGAEAMKKMLSSLELEEERVTVRDELRETGSEAKSKKLVKRLKLIEAFLDPGARPEWMIIDVLPVITPNLRPLVPLDGGPFATAHLNDLYRRVLNRTTRMNPLTDLRAPTISLRHDTHKLQENAKA